MPLPRFRTTLAITVFTAGALAVSARAAAPHRVLPGETLWSIAAANNFTTRTIAAFNGLSVDSAVYAGQTIQIPTDAEGAAALASAGVASGSSSTSATAEASHTVTPGESLASIAAANSLSPGSLAADNGLSADALLIIGQTINVPTSSGSASTTSIGAPPPQEHPYWTSPIYCPLCPSGEAYLASNAAAAWDAMRQASQRVYGIDVYPGGPFSAYRSYAPPGTSSHEYGYALDLADPSMRTVVDEIGANYGWAKTEAPDEWWHVNYVGP